MLGWPVFGFRALPLIQERLIMISLPLPVLLVKSIRSSRFGTGAGATVMTGEATWVSA